MRHEATIRGQRVVHTPGVGFELEAKACFDGSAGFLGYVRGMLGLIVYERLY